MLNKLEKLAGLENLSDWEKTFIFDLQERKNTRENFTFSEKQTAILQKIEKERSPK